MFLDKTYLSAVWTLISEYSSMDFGSNFDLSTKFPTLSKYFENKQNKIVDITAAAQQVK